MIRTQVNPTFLKNLLRDQNISGRRLARRLRMDQSALSRMFNGKREMSAGELVEIAKATGTPIAMLADHVKLRYPAPASKQRKPPRRRK